MTREGRRERQRMSTVWSVSLATLTDKHAQGPTWPKVKLKQPGLHSEMTGTNWDWFICLFPSLGCR